jgi:glycosyltransferase involved in cell wall biosynthesis
VEVEGLSCLEAVKQGVVPVIADAKLSATSQFALDNRSMFPVSDSRRLAEKIDWWIEHPEERRKMSRKYAESTRNYDIRESARRIMEMYEEALRDA